MTLLTHFVRFVTGGCRHLDTYRERRPLHGVAVMHLVCVQCGHAVPALQRTAREHRRTVKAGEVRLPRARRKDTAVVELVRARRQSA